LVAALFPEWFLVARGAGQDAERQAMVVQAWGLSVVFLALAARESLVVFDEASELSAR
jgi:hypothetical protein